MITLKKIAVEGYKSIAKAEVELRDLNVIVGANGSGKSNFLGVFKEIYKLSKSLEYKTPLHNPDRLLHHGRKKTKELEFRIEKDLEQFTFKSTTHLDELFLFLAGTKFFKGSELFQVHNQENLTHQILQSAEKKLFSDLVLYHFDDASENSPAKQTNDLHDNRFFRPDAANLAAYLYRLKINHPHEFNRIQDCIRLVAPYFEHFILEPQEIKGGFIKLEWKQKGSDAYFDTYSLSDGTLRFICLATLLMQPEPPALILLDEPELGLHPFAITLLAEMLEDAAVKSQVILATQSVTLLNWMKLENIIVAEHDGQATSFKRLDEEALAPWLDEYSMGDLWEKNLIGGRP